jgi:hypothetical protein
MRFPFRSALALVVALAGASPPRALAAQSTTTTKADTTLLRELVARNTADADAIFKLTRSQDIKGRSKRIMARNDSILVVAARIAAAAVRVDTVTVTVTIVRRDTVYVTTPPPPPPPSGVRSILLSAADASLVVGRTTAITALPKDAAGVTLLTPVTLSAAPSAVGTIAGSIVTARGAGALVVTARADTVVRTLSIAVADSAPTGTTTTTGGGPVVAAPVTIAAGPATLPELPRASVDVTYPTGGRGVRVCATCSLQTAINAAAPGDVLLLAPGATYTGNLELPAKAACSSGVPSWIVVRTDVADSAIGAPGTRMTPTRAAAARLARIATPNNQSAIATQLGACWYRFTGVDVGATAAATDINALVKFGTDERTQTTANTAGRLIVDRSYVHGSTTLQVRRCVLLNSATSAVVDSWLADCHSNISDSQAIVGWNGPGPFLIQNNHLEGGHEIINWGGGTFTVTGGSPSDITIRGNHIVRPVSWRNVWQAKNLLETKHVKRLLVEGNVLENNWADAQAGFALVLKAENQEGDNPWTQSADVTIRYNRIRNTGSCFSFAGKYSAEDPRVSVFSARFAVYDNICENVNVAPFSADGIATQVLNGMTDLVMAHNTIRNAGASMQALLFDGVPSVRLAYHSNGVHNGQYGVFASGGSGVRALANFAPGSLFANNMIVGGDCGQLPATTQCPATWPTTFGPGYDAAPIGARVAAVDSATRSAVVVDGSSAARLGLFSAATVPAPAPRLSVPWRATSAEQRACNTAVRPSTAARCAALRRREAR